MEYITRSSSAIADIAAMAISRVREQRSTPRVRILLDVPSWHYCHPVVTKFAQGLCTASEALNWMDAVDRRHDQIHGVWVEAIRYELGRRGIYDYFGYEICTSSKNCSAALSIRKALSDGQIPALDDILQALAEGDNHWRDFYARIPLKERPSNIKGLGYLYYVFEVVKPALANHLDRETTGMDESEMTSTFRQDSKITSKPRCLIISVDDSAERRIYSRVQDLLKKIRASPNKIDTVLVEAYMCKRIVVNGDQTRGRFYYHDPMPDVPVRDNDSGCEKDPVMPLDVVCQLYGCGFARRLKGWFVDVGLLA